MILYFSATGNTELIAKTLAEHLGDACVDLLARLKAGDTSDICSERPFVLCSPIYVSELPVFISDYFKKVTLKGNSEVYGVFTNGGYSGIAGGQLKKIVRGKHMLFKGYAEFKMASNHITNKSHKPVGEATIRERTEAALAKADTVAQVIEKGEYFKNRHIFLLEYILTLPVAPILCHLNQTTKEFWVKKSCIGCGKCARLCPMNVIEMQGDKPLWIKDRCAHCMSCIQNCPTEAIEFATVTEGRKRYHMER